jgi:hypothetical protein
MLDEQERHLAWRRRVDAAHDWRDGERPEYDAAVDRIIDLAQTVPDPAGHRTRRAA